MKNDGPWIFFGCCVLAASLFYAGYTIADHLPDRPNIPNSLYVTTNEQGAVKEFGDYLSTDEAAEYLNLSRKDVENLIESGEWGQVVYMVDDSYIISKTALQEWADEKIRGE